MKRRENMKIKVRILSLLLMALMVIGLSACGSVDNRVPAQAEDQVLAHEPENENNDILVVYFSRTGEQYTVGVIEKGNTAIVAELIAEKSGANLFELIPEDDHYPVTYSELTDVAKQEQKSGMTFTKSDLVDAPVVNEFPIAMECEFIEFQDDETGLGVIGKVLRTSVEEANMKDGKVDIDSLEAIAFDPYTHGYYKV